MSSLFLERVTLIKGINAVADAFAATVYSDVMDMSEYGQCSWLVHSGVGATGTSTITVNACDDIVPTTESAVPFWYRQYGVGASGAASVEGSVTLATTAGFLTTAGTGRLIILTVTADQMASTGYRYVRAKFVEGTASAVLGGVIAVLSDPRFRPRIAASAID